MRPARRELRDPRLVEPEDDAPLRLRRRVVEVHDRPLRAGDRLERPLDQLGPRLRQDCDRHAVGDQILLDEQPHEVEVGLRRRGEADLDLLEAEPDEEVEEAALPRGVHRVDERLVPVAEVDRAPDRRAREHDVRPRPVGQLDCLVRPVFPVRHRHGGSRRLLPHTPRFARKTGICPA